MDQSITTTDELGPLTADTFRLFRQLHDQKVRQFATLSEQAKNTPFPSFAYMLMTMIDIAKQLKSQSGISQPAD